MTLHANCAICVEGMARGEREKEKQVSPPLLHRIKRKELLLPRFNYRKERKKEKDDDGDDDLSKNRIPFFPLSG